MQKEKEELIRSRKFFKKLQEEYLSLIAEDKIPDKNGEERNQLFTINDNFTIINDELDPGLLKEMLQTKSGNMSIFYQIFARKHKILNLKTLVDL